MTKLFKNHIATLLEQYQLIIAQQNQQGLAVERILIGSGSHCFYYADDQTIPFRAFGHFCRWLPLNRPDQFLLVAPGERPIYFQVVSSDYWNDQSIEIANWWCDEFELVTLSNKNQLAECIANYEGLVFLGENTAFAKQLEFDQSMINPLSVLNHLDYYRAYKTGYEVEQIRLANTKALTGHDAAKSCFENGGSEYEVHMSYLQACNILEEDCPYTNIVAINEKSAILHYQHKRHDKDQNSSEKNQVLLIDAGCKVNNYCSDITRTVVRPNAHGVFRSLLSAVDKLQLRLIDQSTPTTLIFIEPLLPCLDRC
jgi:Xaa-Pro dipeptidase